MFKNNNYFYNLYITLDIIYFLIMNIIFINNRILDIKKLQDFLIRSETVVI